MLPCPGRGAAFFMPLRRAGTVTNAGACYGPGSAKHHAVKNGVLHRARDTDAHGTKRRSPRLTFGLERRRAMLSRSSALFLATAFGTPIAAASAFAQTAPLKPPSEFQSIA